MCCARSVGNSFSTERPRKCGENVVAAASVAEIYYSVTLQAHSREKEKEGKRNLHRDTLALLFARESTTRDSIFQVRLRSLFVGLHDSLYNPAQILDRRRKRNCVEVIKIEKMSLYIRYFHIFHRALFRDGRLRQRVSESES